MRIRRASLLAASTILAAATTWILLSGPMLVDIHTGVFEGEPSLSVLNPTRNRAPERFAETLFAQIHSDGCLTTVAWVNLPTEQKTSACSKQQRLPIVGPCRLVNRKDSGPSSWLWYQCGYVVTKKGFARVGVDVERTGYGYSLNVYRRID